MKKCKYFEKSICIFSYCIDSCYEFNRLSEKMRGFPQIVIIDSKIEKERE